MKKVYFPKQIIDELLDSPTNLERYAFELKEVQKDDKPIKVSLAIGDDTEIRVSFTREQAAKVAKSIITQLTK